MLPVLLLLPSCILHNRHLGYPEYWYNRCRSYPEYLCNWYYYYYYYCYRCCCWCLPNCCEQLGY